MGIYGGHLGWRTKVYLKSTACVYGDILLHANIQLYRSELLFLKPHGCCSEKQNVLSTLLLMISLLKTK